jgi:hypothetical protein
MSPASSGARTQTNKGVWSFCAAETWQRVFSIDWNIKELNNYLNSYKCGMSTITGRAIPRLGFHPHDALTMCKSWL